MTGACEFHIKEMLTCVHSFGRKWVRERKLLRDLVIEGIIILKWTF